MILKPDPIFRALDAIAAERGGTLTVIMTSPQGRRFTQAEAVRLSRLEHLVLLCGRYEGFDERVRAHVDEEVSLGDFVMTGGEVAQMAIVEACVRLLPGVLGNEASVVEESHSPENAGLLEYPHYTRPVEFRGARVPDVLQSGHHAEIAKWRAAEALARTRARRPDLLGGTDARGGRGERSSPVGGGAGGENPPLCETEKNK